MTSLFTHKDRIEGKVGTGTLPENMVSLLDPIAEEYMLMVPDKAKTTYHSYYADLPPSIKSKFDDIQYDNFWDGVSDNTTNCIVENMTEMNEIYYSNPKPNFKNMNLYGASANLIPHRDCILFGFSGISVYRVIIGLTEKNDDTITRFIHFNIDLKINKGDYMIFDFDKTLHQVIKTGQQETPRILLKLHYIVCDSGNYSKEYVHLISYFYKIYYCVARYTEQLGTDPTTFVGFFFGLLWEWPFYKPFRYLVGLLFFKSIILLHTIYEIELTVANVPRLAMYSGANLSSLFLMAVFVYYARYKLFRIR